MFHRKSFCFLSALLVCLWSVGAVGDSNSQGWSDNPELKAAFETGWLDRITTPVPSRLSCKGKTLYKVQPDLNANSYIHEKETLDRSSVNLDVISGLVTFKPQGDGSSEDSWYLGEIKGAGGSQLIIDWGGGQFSSLNFSVLGGELVLVENILYDNKTYSDMSKEYVISDTVIYLCEASNLDEQFRVWLKELGKFVANMAIPYFASTMKIESELLEKSSVDCQDRYVEEGFPLFSDELKAYLIDFPIDQVATANWNDLNPPPPAEWPMEMNSRVNLNFGNCITSGVREPKEPKPVTPEFVDQLTESCVSTPLDKFVFPDPSQVSTELKLRICNCMVQVSIDFGIDGDSSTDWTRATFALGANLGVKDSERSIEMVAAMFSCHELKEDPDTVNPSAKSDAQGPNPGDLQNLMESGQCESCTLTNADLRTFRLENIEISHSELVGANMSGLILKTIDVTESDLSNANLSDVTTVYGVTLFRSNLSNANISGLACTDCFMPNFTDSNLIGANLSGLNARGAEFVSANLTDADLSESQLVDAQFQGAILENTDLSNSNLTGASFAEGYVDGAILVRVDFRNSNLTKVSFRNASLKWPDFTGAILCRTIMPDGKRNDSGCP